MPEEPGAAEAAGKPRPGARCEPLGPGDSCRYWGSGAGIRGASPSRARGCGVGGGAGWAFEEGRGRLRVSPCK